MGENVYKHIEVTGTSSQSIEQAVQNALTRAGKTVRNMRWFEVTETRGTVSDDKVSEWQVSLRIGFSLE